MSIRGLQRPAFCRIFSEMVPAHSDAGQASRQWHVAAELQRKHIAHHAEALDAEAPESARPARPSRGPRRHAARGAPLVLLPPTALLLALHFGSSLVLVTSVLLTALVVRQQGSWDNLRDRPLPAGYRWLAFGMAGFTYVVGFLGAYLRQRGVELACNQWPVCRDGSLLPGAAAGGGIAFAHRLAALLLALGAVGLFVWGRRLGDTRPDLYRGSQWVLALVLAQALVGPRVVWNRVAEGSPLLHAAPVPLVFGPLGSP